ncbi:hypothetical protein OROHE_010101 [Orobanche hederae]
MLQIPLRLGHHLHSRRHQGNMAFRRHEDPGLVRSRHSLL